MFPSYNDVRTRIDSPPLWYTKHGYPRYDHFRPAQCSIYAQYSLLMEIGCQDCEARMMIGEDYDSFERMLVALDTTKIDTKIPVSEDGHVWIPLRYGTYAPTLEGVYKDLTLEELVKGWGFGDPPRHDCPGAGETMGCVELRSVQVWSVRHGQETTPAEDGKYNVITKFGEPSRIPELENYQFEIPDWYRFG